MESLFSPSTRSHAILDGLEGQFGLEEIGGHLEPNLEELNLDISTEDFLSAERAFTFADLYAMLGNEHSVLWLTPHAAVVPKRGGWFNRWKDLYKSCRIRFIADGKEIIACARSLEHLLEICYVVLQLLAASVVQSVILREWTYRGLGEGVWINPSALAYLMERCQSLKVLTLEDLEMDENVCRVLGAYSRRDLEINLDTCKLTSAGTSALATVLGRNQGPTEIVHCDTDYSVLSNGLRGNSRLQSFRPRHSNYCDPNIVQELRAIADALKENNGLVDLDLSGLRPAGFFRVDFEMWDTLCNSFKTHPTLQVLDLRGIRAHGGTPLCPAVALSSQMQALVDMLKLNMSIQTVLLYDYFLEHELFRGSVIPYLETNRLQPCVRAIQKTRPITYRAKVLGRALGLHAVRTDANRFWMLLSGNPEIAFPSTTARTTAAASFSAPANDAVVTAS